MTLVESQLNESAYFLTTPVENIIDQVMDAKIETGEELPEDEREALDLVVDNIHQAQRTLRPYVQSGKIAVHRALVVTPEWLEDLQPGTEIGVYWSYAFDGAFAYNGKNDRLMVVFSGVVDVDEVDWITTIAVHSGDEAEIRLYPDATVTISQIATKANRYDRNAVPVRPDLTGKEMRA
jgi:hypothetical protein